MSLTGTIKGWAWSLIVSHSSVPVYRGLPFGCDLMLDIAKLLPAFRPEIVFDVGANVGQSAALFLERWPAARIHCFEPVAATFEKLEARLGGDVRVRLHRLAISAGEGVGEMLVEARSTRSSLRSAASSQSGATVEQVRLSTLDGFCDAEAVERISFLKIDTEGADLDVLLGGDRLLGDAAIDLVQVEAGMYRGNDKHVSLEALKDHLETRGYHLFGIYEQHPERLSRRPIMRRANPVFVSPRLAEESAPLVDWKKV